MTTANPRIAEMTTALTAELAQTESDLAGLRDEREAINDRIRAKVAERDELQSTLAKLRPRPTRGRNGTTETQEIAPGDVAPLSSVLGVVPPAT